MSGKVVGFPTRATHGTRSSKSKPMRLKPAPKGLAQKLLRAKYGKSKK